MRALPVSPDGILAKSTAQMLSEVFQPPLQIAMAAARLLYLPRLQEVVPIALLILLDANRSWRDVLLHDCLSMWLQASFVNQVLPHRDGPMLLSWCDFATTSTRLWKHMVKSWVPQAAWDEDSPQPCGAPLHTDVQLHWLCYEYGLCRAVISRSTAAHAAVSFASRFVFDCIALVA